MGSSLGSWREIAFRGVVQDTESWQLRAAAEPALEEYIAFAEYAVGVGRVDLVVFTGRSDGDRAYRGPGSRLPPSGSEQLR